MATPWAIARVMHPSAPLNFLGQRRLAVSGHLLGQGHSRVEMLGASMFWHLRPSFGAWRAALGALLSEDLGLNLLGTFWPWDCEQ